MEAERHIYKWYVCREQSEIAGGDGRWQGIITKYDTKKSAKQEWEIQYECEVNLWQKLAERWNNCDTAA